MVSGEKEAMTILGGGDGVGGGWWEQVGGWVGGTGELGNRAT